MRIESSKDLFPKPIFTEEATDKFIFLVTINGFKLFKNGACHLCLCLLTKR